MPHASEARKSQLFPAVAFRGEGADRRAWLQGTALDVWEIVAARSDFESVVDMASESDLSEAQIEDAVAYHRRFPTEIDDFVGRCLRSLQDVRVAFPEIAVESHRVG